jgi:Tol biopolymer transport system component
VYQATVDPQTLRVKDPPTRLETYIGHNSTPAWSPSGDSFAYYSGRELNKGFRLVVHHPDGKEVMWSAAINHLNPPNWCTGGDRLMAICTPNCYTRRLIDSRTGETSGTDSNLKLQTPYQIDYSPDCNSVYVSTYLAAAQRRRIYLVDVQSGKQTEVTADGGEWAVTPRVSPDGRWLALYGVVEGGKKRGLLVVSTAGGAIRMLDPEGEFGPAWTPDSNRLMYTREVKRASGQGKEHELFWIPVEGGTPQPMGIRMPGVLAPSLNPDGKRLLFSAGEGYQELWVLRNLSLN